ncbi:Hypothetical predicted protein [Mytilus galloprovincialis]|nr:Hypothetical predicted protein [Mytilus galloprovincialis]
MKKRLLPLLNSYQIQKLYPEDSKYTGDLSDMDISLLYIILRNIGTICPHQNGWGKEPEDDDRSISANIDRIRIAKNAIVSHSSNYSIEYIEFRNIWTAMRQCCVDLGGERYKERIDVLLTSLLNCDLEQQMCEIFESLKEQDLQNERHSRRLEEVVECLTQLSDYVKKKHPFVGRETSTENSESCTLGALRLKGSNLPDKKEIEKQIGDYHNKDLRVTSVDDGSVVIILAMFTTSFGNFRYFLTVIDELLQSIFSVKPASEDKRSDLINISLELFEPSAKKEDHPQYLTTSKTQRERNEADSKVYKQIYLQMYVFDI